MRQFPFALPLSLAALLLLSNCATTRETVQECRKSASSFCEKRAGVEAGAARTAAYQQCMETQVAACGAP
jgi:hypothetical protein